MSRQQTKINRIICLGNFNKNGPAWNPQNPQSLPHFSSPIWKWPLSSSDPPHSGSIYLVFLPNVATGGNIWHPLICTNKDWHLTIHKYIWRRFCPATSTMWNKLILNSQGFGSCNLRYYSPSLQGNIAASERPETVLHAIVIRNKMNLWSWQRWSGFQQISWQCRSIYTTVNKSFGCVFACPLISSATQDFLKQIDMVLYNFKPTWPQLACMATTVFIGNSPGSCSHGYWRIGNTGIQVLHDVGIKPKVLLCSLCSGIVAFLFCSVFKLCFWCCSQVFAMLHTFLSL